MQDAPKVMLGMSFFKASCDDAEATAKAFSQALWDGSGIVIGVETDGLCCGMPEMNQFIANRKSENWADEAVYVWDEVCDEKFFLNWPSELPKPFYAEGFSYGGSVNRLLALARIANCEYLIRVDPGTAPPYYFKEMVRHHIETIRSKRADIVSGQYSDRIALRDDFVPREKLKAYYDFVQDFTGIDPCRQITGGAALTINVRSGPPPIPFAGYTPVWGSDDGLYATIAQRTFVHCESRIMRKEPGKAARHDEEYPVRLASMVALRRLMKGSSQDASERAGCEFLELLREHGYYSRFILIEAQAELKKRLPNIVSGLDNYTKLRAHWAEVIEKVAEVADNLKFPRKVKRDSVKLRLRKQVA